MIKETDLYEYRPNIRYDDSEGVTLKNLAEALGEAFKQYDIPVGFANDQVKTGGLFNSEIEDCLVLYHPEHTGDYYRFAIRIKHQGKMAFVIVNNFGNSTQMNKFARAESNKEARRGQSLSYKLGNAAVSGLLNIGKNKNKLEQEQMYYNVLSAIFDEVIG